CPRRCSSGASLDVGANDPAGQRRGQLADLAGQLGQRLLALLRQLLGTAPLDLRGLGLSLSAQLVKDLLTLGPGLVADLGGLGAGLVECLVVALLGRLE